MTTPTDDAWDDLLPCPVCEQPPKVARGVTHRTHLTISCCSMLCPPVIALFHPSLAVGKWNAQHQLAMADPAWQQASKLRAALTYALGWLEDEPQAIAQIMLGEMPSPERLAVLLEWAAEDAEFSFMLAMALGETEG